MISWPHETTVPDVSPEEMRRLRRQRLRALRAHLPERGHDARTDQLVDVIDALLEEVFGR